MQSILIVDDRSENLIALETLLEQPNLLLLKADNGNDALKLLLKHDVALVLLDVQMPGMNGFEMAELMRRNRKTQSIPIIFVTANGDKRQLFRGYEVGAVDYLAKPIDRDVLTSKVKVFLELDRQKQELEKQLLQIQQLKHQNEQLLHALGDGVVAVDAGGDISFVNPAIQLLFALDPVKMLGMHLADILFQDEDGQKTPWQQSDVFTFTNRGQRLQREIGFYIKTDNGMVPVQISAAAITSPNGYAGSVITLRTNEELQDGIQEEIARRNRRQTRKRIGTVLRLFDRTSGLNLGRLANISMDGFKLAAKNELSVGHVYALSMILPETLAGSNTLSFDAQAVWCRQADDAPGEFRVGFRITKIGENDLKILIQLIEKY